MLHSMIIIVLEACSSQCNCVVASSVESLPKLFILASQVGDVKSSIQADQGDTYPATSTVLIYQGKVRKASIWNLHCLIVPLNHPWIRTAGLER